MLRIAIDASRTTLSRVTGTEHYATQLIRALIQFNSRHSHHHITLYFRDSPPENLFPTSDQVEQRVIRLPRLWTHLRFAAQLWRDRPDVVFVPAHTLPALFPGRAVVTVHDLGFKHFPEAHPLRQRLYLNWTTQHSARRAAVILADSQATANDLMRFYAVPKSKIRVVYPGVEAPKISSPAQVRQKYGLPEHYFLFIGTLQPRKNIARIVQAFARCQERHPEARIKLVLAGGKGWLYDDIWTHGVEDIYMPGYIDEADKGALYAGALALVFPSLYEGFGFPILEAMHCGTPVIASSTSSLPELAGDAALLVDPLDVNMIAQAMNRLVDSPEQRNTLRASGYAQAACFTWESAAEQAMSALESAARG